MNRFKNILFVHDNGREGQTALERAVSLAELNHARLTVVSVADPVDEQLKIDERLGISVRQLVHDESMKALATLVEPYQKAEQMIYTQVLSGSPFAEIIKSVIQSHYDLVIKASCPPANLGEQLLGSTDMHLLRKCPCPVWIDKPNKTIPYKKILAAVDPDGDPGAADNILKLATSLAQREQAQLQIVHAWQLQGESLIRHGRARLAVADIDSVVEEERQRHLHKLDALLEKYNLSASDDNVLLLKGKAVETILQAGESADLIVMGTIGRAGVPGFIIGNTAEEVMQMTQASIMAVKPEGYVSPLAPTTTL